MGIGTLLYYILRIVKPYRWLLVVTLVLTLLGSLLAQVNAIVLDRAVDAINVLDQQPTLMWPSAYAGKLEKGRAQKDGRAFHTRPAPYLGICEDPLS